MAQMVGLLPPTLNTWLEFQVPGFGIAQLQSLQTFEESTREWELLVSQIIK